jgi:O-antigen/teichoic acid export membrane protein
LAASTLGEAAVPVCTETAKGSYPNLINSDPSELANATQVSRGRTVVNAMANFGHYAVAMVIGLFLQAFVIRSLGKTEYALWPLVSTAMAFVALIPAGIGSGTGRFIAHALGRQQPEEVEQITTSAFAGLCVATGLYVMGTILLSVFFERIFTIPPGVQGTGPWAMLLAGLSGAVRIPFSVYDAGLRATQRFVAINIIQAVFLCLRAGLIVLVFHVDQPRLVWLGAAALAIETCSGLASWLVARRVVPWQRVRWASFRWSTLRMVSGFSLWMLVIQVANLLYWQTDNIIINKLIDPVLVTGYSVVVNFVLQLFLVTSLGCGVLLSAATVLHAQKDLPRIARMIYRANRIMVPLGVPLLVFLMLFGREVLVLYLHKEEYGDFAILFPLFGIGAILSTTQTSGQVVPQACGKVALNSLVSLGMAAAHLVLGIILVARFGWGLLGIASATAVVWVLGMALFWPWYVATLLEVPLLSHYVKAVIVPLAHCLPAAAVLVAARLLWPEATLLTLACILGATFVLHAAYLLAYGLPAEDRSALWNMLSGRWRAMEDRR